MNSPHSAFATSSNTTRRRRLSQIYRPGPRHPDPAGNSFLADTSRRLDLTRQNGDFSLAYTTAVLSRLKYFGDDRGYIAYDRRMGCTFVLGDPVAAPQQRELLIRQFVAQEPRVTFCQISPATAQVVQRLGFYVNEMGVDTVISLPEYDFRGQDKKWLRYAEAWTSRRGFTTGEQTVQQVGADQIESVSLAWRATRHVKRREVRFLNRPIVISDEPGTRRFYFFDAAQRLLAFVFFDPLYRSGQLIGYVACTKRRHPDAPVYAEQTIMKHAIEVFQKEGCQELRLGLSPFASIEDREFRSDWLLNKMFRYVYSSSSVNKFFYNVQGHAEYKRRFRGHEEKVYLATGPQLIPWRLIALVKLCRIV